MTPTYTLFVSVRSSYLELNLMEIMKHFSALNPNCKMAYVEDKWDDEYVVEAKQCFETLVSYPPQYIYMHSLSFGSLKSTMPPMLPRNCSPLLVSACYCFQTTMLTWLEESQGPLITNAASSAYGAAWMRDSIKARKATDSSKIDPLEELNSYLKAPLEDVEDIIGWWGVRCIPIILRSTVLTFNFSITRCNTQLYPTLPKTISPSRARLYRRNMPSRAVASLMLLAVTALLPRHLLPCRSSKLLTEINISQQQ